MGLTPYKPTWILPTSRWSWQLLQAEVLLHEFKRQFG